MPDRDPTLRSLAEEAAAEAKRHSQSPSAWHVAQAIARRDREDFEERFGAGAAARVLQRPGPADAPPLDATLAPISRGDFETVADRLQSLIGDALAAAAQATGRPEPRFRTAPTPEHGPPFHGHVEPLELPPSQEAALDEVVVQLRRRTPGTPLIIAERGAGRSSFAGGLKRRLEAREGTRLARTVVRFSAGDLLDGDPARNLDTALDALRPGTVALIDDLELLLGLHLGDYYRPCAFRLRVAVERPDVEVVLALDARHLARLESADPALLAECKPVELPAPSGDELRDILRAHARGLAEHHAVELTEALIDVAASPRTEAESRAHPGLGVERLDTALSRAAMRGATVATVEDLGLASSPATTPIATDDLRRALTDDVRGQDEAVERLVSRVALTRAKLDLRPDRPDGVLLFVGPTGVGKTQLARSLCRALFGDEHLLIRLDMSEYGDSWAVSRLIGPQPGYVGFTEPEAWLTTRIRQRPRTVLLLDEIEKADPSVWNAFLQVFDAGRLSDSRGNVASFSDIVVIMTSNLGARSFTSTPVGFSGHHDDGDRAATETLEAVRSAMSPELVNRIDEVIVFEPLPPETIADIAAEEIRRLCARLRDRGYRLTVPAQVVAFIAETGYDPAYGARHLQRNIERLLMVPLAARAGELSLTAEVVDRQVRWLPA